MKFMSKKQVREVTTLSFAHIDRLECQERFPRRRKLTGAANGRVVWVDEEIYEWMQSRPIGEPVSPDASDE